MSPGAPSVPSIPWSRLEAVLLDAGNTLVCLDFGWVAAELSARGVPCAPEALRRAEAAARPAVSELAARKRRTEGHEAFLHYLGEVLGRLEGASPLPADERGALARELAPVLRRRGSRGLWSRVIPGVPEALEELRSLDLRLAVVSNSDGTVEELLEGLGLRRHVDAVLDSHRVGSEKPDPDIFHHALRRLGVPADRALHVGDLYAADVVGARAAGVHALLLDPFGDWEGAAAVDCQRLPDLRAVAERARHARCGWRAGQ